MRMIAIIPARAGSKGLPGKNMRIFAGKPLVHHAIETARNCPRFAAVYVTSDEPALLDLARDEGAIAIERPHWLATDDATMVDVVRHVDKTIELAGGEHGDAFALMQPTSPLRKPDDIVFLLDQFAAGNWASAVTVCSFEHPPQKALVITDNALSPLFGWPALHSNRQALLQSYRQNGVMWAVRWNAFREFGQFVVAPAMPYVMDALSSIDIDTQVDFDAAEKAFRAIRGNL